MEHYIYITCIMAFEGNHVRICKRHRITWNNQSRFDFYVYVGRNYAIRCISVARIRVIQRWPAQCA